MNGEPPDKKKQRDDFFRALSLFSQIGITMASCVLVGVLLGRFLDRLFHTAPWLLLIFSLLGAASALKALFDFQIKK